MRTTSKRTSTAAKAKERLEGHTQAHTAPSATGAELALVGAAISGGKLTYEIAVEVVKYVKSNKPIAVQVLDSRVLNSDGAIYLRLTNLTGHGLCVFGIASIRPSVTQPRVQRLVLTESDGPLSVKEVKPQDPPLPFVIPPTESQDVRLLFDLAATKKEIYNALHGSVRIDFEVLGEASPDKLDVKFRFREDMPVASSFAAFRVPRG